MAANARRKLLGRARKAVFHCTARCVRRAFLCGLDPTSGEDYSHRRDWIVNRQQQLAQLFTIEVEFRAELSNHLHVVLRTRPEIAARLRPREVARRWLTITKLAKCMSDEMPEPDEKRIDKLVGNKKQIEKLRRRLSKISWFMGILLENIARRANFEDHCGGRFWETRFKCREITDASGLLLCGIYVDLNPIRAGEADSPETARYTSLFQRLEAQSQRKNARDRADGWMAELTLRPERKADEALAYSSRSGRRASDLGVLPISLEDYVMLFKWTARLLKSGERSKIPKDLEGVLDKLDVNHEKWVDTVDSYERSFCHAVGSPESLAKVAERMEASHLKGVTAQPSHLHLAPSLPARQVLACCSWRFALDLRALGCTWCASSLSFTPSARSPTTIDTLPHDCTVSKGTLSPAKPRVGHVKRQGICFCAIVPSRTKGRVSASASASASEKLRRRLSKISWFMGILLENIARRANFEDNCGGRFWETRFKCREITDASGLLLCGIYVDLNPIRAGEADSPETARYTSLFQRLEAQSRRKNARDRADGWMAELTLRPERKADEALAYSSRSGRRASDLGVLPISLADYLKLLLWTARLLASGQRSKIPKDLEAVLDRLDVNHEKWLDTVDSYERSFCHAVGSPESLAKVAERMEASHLKGATASRRIFT